MSDVEEPPTKMSKYEEYLEDEILEEGQEEWLSEGVLTDDDYHITQEEQDESNTNLEHMSQEDQDTMTTAQESEHLDESNNTEQDKSADQNIEDTLNNLDGKNGLPDDLDTFLIRKTDGRLVETKVKQEDLMPRVKDEDDGNDTDDLLRLLEDDQQVKKKAVRIIKREKTEDQGSSDDDEFIYERSKVKTLKVAKNALIKRVPSKAVPEQMSDTDDDTDISSDEVTMKRMFGVKPSGKPNPKGEPRKVVKHVVQVNSSYSKIEKQKPSLQKTIPRPTPSKIKTETRHFKSVVKTPAPFKPLEKPVPKTQSGSKTEEKKADQLKTEELDEIIDGEEFLEEENFDLDEEEFGEESEADHSKKQRIMRPEMMDEEVPSDEESRSEDGSLYDELPSSDSEDFDDWFTLDIRAERASDYLPLLGGCARALLTAERRRALSRVSTLRHSLSALTDSARRQADSLRHAAMALAELDDTLRAA